MANAIYSANLSNLKKIFQNIQDNPAINDINVELTFGPNEDGTFPLIYARFDISDLTKLETDLSPGTDSVHQQFCKNSGKLIKRKKKSLDAFFKNHGLIPFLIDSFSEQILIIHIGSGMGFLIEIDVVIRLNARFRFVNASSESAWFAVINVISISFEESFECE